MIQRDWYGIKIILKWSPVVRVNYAMINNKFYYIDVNIELLEMILILLRLVIGYFWNDMNYLLSWERSLDAFWQDIKSFHRTAMVQHTASISVMVLGDMNVS